MMSVLALQGFDKYGVGAHTSLPTTLLQSELGFKVIAPSLALPFAARRFSPPFVHLQLLTAYT